MKNLTRDPRDRFDELYRQTSDDILAYLVRRTRSVEDAADALAETYAAAWRKLDSLPDGDGARMWLFGAARNELRKAAGRQRAEDDLTIMLMHDLRPLLEEQANDNDRDEELRAALATLSRLDYEILTLTAWEDLAPRQIAAVLDLSANVVRIRLHRTRSNLRKLLKPEQRLEAAAAPAV